MEIKATQIVGKEYVGKACSFTINKEVNPSMKKMYLSEHSPIRCSIFWIEMKDIFTFVSTHFVRHKYGVEHFVKSNREDRSSYTGDQGRNTLLNHAMMINAQSLINMARKRLCSKSHSETVKVMLEIKKQVTIADPDLGDFLIPECEYRGKCPEFTTCGRFKNSKV